MEIQRIKSPVERVLETAQTAGDEVTLTYGGGHSFINYPQVRTGLVMEVSCGFVSLVNGDKTSVIRLEDIQAAETVKRKNV